MRSAFAGLDPGYGRAARSLGASEWRVFSRIHLRLAFQPILANAAGEFLGVANGDRAFQLQNLSALLRSDRKRHGSPPLCGASTGGQNHANVLHHHFRRAGFDKV